MKKEALRKIIKEEILKKVKKRNMVSERQAAAQELILFFESYMEKREEMMLLREFDMSSFEMPEGSEEFLDMIPAPLMNWLGNRVENLEPATKDFAGEVLTGVILNATAQALGLPSSVTTDSPFGRAIRNFVPKIVSHPKGIELITSAILQRGNNSEADCVELVNLVMDTFAETAKEEIFDRQIMTSFIDSFTESMFGQRMDPNMVTQIAMGIPRETLNIDFEKMLRPMAAPIADVICKGGSWEDFKMKIIDLARQEATPEDIAQLGAEVSRSMSRDEINDLISRMTRR